MADKQASNVPTTPRDPLATWGGRLAMVRQYFDGYKAKDGYDARRLTKGQKSAITRRVNQVTALQREIATEPGVRLVATRTRNKRALTQLAALEPVGVTYPKGFKARAVRLLPTVQRITIDRRGNIVQHLGETDGVEGIRVVLEPVDPKRLVTDTENVVREVIARHPDACGFTLRTGQAGWVRSAGDASVSRNRLLDIFEDREEQDEILRGQLTDLILKMAHRYGANVPDLDDEPRADDEIRDLDVRARSNKSHYWKNWMTGVAVFYMPECRDYDEFFAFKHAQQMEKRKVRRKVKKKGYAWMKGRSR